MPAAPATKAAIKRAIEAVAAAGLTVRSVQVARDGTISIDTVPPDAAVDTPARIGQPAPKRWATK